MAPAQQMETHAVIVHAGERAIWKPSECFSFGRRPSEATTQRQLMLESVENTSQVHQSTEQR